MREFTSGRGVDHVIEVGGVGTLQKSIKATRHGGYIHVVGVLSSFGQQQTPEPFDFAAAVLRGGVHVRGLSVGSKGMFENMNRLLENHRIKPVIDQVFTFGQAKQAFSHLASQQHFGKIVIVNTENKP